MPLDNAAWAELASNLGPSTATDPAPCAASQCRTCADCCQLNTDVELREKSGSSQIETAQTESFTLSSPMRAPDAIELSAVKCSQCKKYASIWWSGSWQKVDDVLHIGLMDSINYSTTDLLEVQSAQDFLRVFVLSQFCHNHLDIDLATSESPFCPPSPDDVIKMATVQGQAAGFYSIKRKGSLFPQYPHVRYAIDVMDTMYVRRQFRRHGIATRFLDDLLLQFSDDDKNQLIGFSEPISDALLKVLQRYVTNHPSTCDRLWGCSYTGEAGYRWNIHLRLKAEKSRQADVT